MKTAVFPILLFLILGAAIIFSGCTDKAGPSLPQSPATTTPVPHVTHPDTSNNDISVSDANTRFAFDLYKKLSGDPAHSGTNLVFSPYSISSAMGVMYEGAQGQTADEILLVSHLPENDTMRRQEFSKIYEDMNHQDANITVLCANALWVEKSYPLLPEYTQTIQQYYSTNVTNLDFAGHPDDARITINQWVESNTNNKIHEIISPGDLDAQTAMVFTNSVYFMGAWESPFDKTQTFDTNFTIAPNTTVPVMMMAKADLTANFNYTETGDFQMIEIPYKYSNETALSMFVLLPVNNNLTAAEDTLSAPTFLNMEENLSREEKHLFLPRFRIDTREDISGTLQTMGMPTVFTSGADFSKITPNSGIYVKEVTHDAEIEVNEEGT
ncbi:MAG: serpin family protein, partial [Methanoregula sp.]